MFTCESLIFMFVTMKHKRTSFGGLLRRKTTEAFVKTAPSLLSRKGSQESWDPRRITKNMERPALFGIPRQSFNFINCKSHNNLDTSSVNHISKAIELEETLCFSKNQAQRTVSYFSWTWNGVRSSCAPCRGPRWCWMLD